MNKVLAILLLATGVSAQPPSDVWERVERVPVRPAADAWIQPQKFHAFNLNHGRLRSMLARAGTELPQERRRPDAEITLPMPDGSFARFLIIESPVMAPELAAKFPEIKTYRGVGVDDPQASVRLDLTPQGFHAQILSPRGAVYIDPYWRGDNVLHASYYKRDYRRQTDWACFARGSDAPATTAAGESDIVAQTSGATLRTYRLACAATGEYTAFHGGTVAAGQAAIVTAVNRVTGVYEIEFAIRLVLVANNDQIVYTNANTDPYTNNNPSSLLTQNQSTCDSVIGSANYDIGHVFSTAGGGLAALGVVCKAGSKAQGETGTSSPTGDGFWIDYVAHEMGHQFGGNHTFNSTTSNCGGGNRNASTAYEPGSGSTIMAYAGICGSDDLQPHSDPYFHWISQQEIINYVGTQSCQLNTSTGNNPPNIPSTSGNFIIPASTPFMLTATGSDPDGDALTYCWEEADLGAATTLTAPDNGASPLFRSFPPTNSPTRIFPRIQDVLGNTNSLGEKLPTTSRTMKFRVTVRDNRLNGGGVERSATNAITVVSAAGPFQVTFPNTATNLSGLATVMWDVAGTTASPINCTNVDILLSTNGGFEFPIVLAAGTPNDGAQAVMLPDLTTSAARIMVRGAGNIFFDLSNANFSITPAPPVLMAAGSATLTAESCAAPNAAIDPGETVTVDFGLRNFGSSNAPNVTATLLATGGVSAPSGAQSYGTLPAGGSNVVRSFSFTATGACGGTLTATLQVQTNGLTIASVPFGFTLGATALSTRSATNSTFIKIPATGNSGPATPYPSNISIAGVDGLISKVTVTLRNLYHTWPDDVDVLLVGPTGAKTLLMSDTGGGNALSGVTLTFDDAAPGPLPDSTPIVSGAYQPTDYDTASDAFTSPAPAGPYVASLAVFNGTNPNGTWSLYVRDDANPDSGSLSNGWSISITTVSNVCCAGAVNQPPVVTNAFITATATNTTQNLTVLVSAFDPESDPVSFAYQWQESLTNLAGQTASVLPAAATFAGGLYRCVITPNDGQTNGPAFPTAAVLVPVDSDGNGLNDDWEVTHFGHIGVDPNADADGDGFSNAQEFAAGTDPNNSASALRVTQIADFGNDFVISFDSVAGKSYELQRSDDLAGGWMPLTNVMAAGSLTFVTDPGGASQPQRFYRVRLLP